MMQDRENRNRGTHAIVTGGTDGLGLAVARRLTQEGAGKIALCGRRADKGRQAEAEIKDLGAECIFIESDIAVPDDCVRLVDQALENFGTVNALVNSAALSTRGTLLDTSLELWQAHFDTNVRGPFLVMQGVVRHLTETRSDGSLVNIISMSALCGQSYLTPYVASKGALSALTKNVAQAFRAQRIRCNGVLVGWMDTPGEDATQKKFHDANDDWLVRAEAAQPMGQLVKPDQVAGLIAYLVSPESGVMTGSLVEYDQHVSGAFPE